MPLEYPLPARGDECALIDRQLARQPIRPFVDRRLLVLWKFERNLRRRGPAGALRDVWEDPEVSPAAVIDAVFAMRRVSGHPIHCGCTLSCMSDAEVRKMVRDAIDFVKSDSAHAVAS